MIGKAITKRKAEAEAKAAELGLVKTSEEIQQQKLVNERMEIDNERLRNENYIKAISERIALIKHLRDLGLSDNDVHALRIIENISFSKSGMASQRFEKNLTNGKT